MTVRYEWVVEYVTADEYEDINDHYFADSCAEAFGVYRSEAPEGHFCRLVLVRDDARWRSWAYVVDDKLPDHFADAYHNEVAKVPARFIKELAKAMA